MRTEEQIDRSLVIAVAVLVGCGVIIVFCASAIRASIEYGSSTFFLRRQLFRVLISLGAMAAVVGADYRLFQRFARVFLGASLLLFLLVQFSSLGLKAGGSQRWIQVFSATFQPVEIFKLSFILFIADHLSRGRARLEHFRTGVLPPVLVFVCATVFLLLQPDFGQVVIAGIILLCMLFTGGVRVRHLAAVSAAFLGTAALAASRIPHCIERIQTYLNPNADPTGAGYQIRQSLIGLGCGGMLGCGPGQGKQKLLFLPDAHTDFLFSIIGEELGMLGCLAVIGLFLFIFQRGVRTGMRALDSFGYLTAVGISFSLLLHALLHIAVCCALIPTTGIPLPFLSYGGSSLLVSMVQVGILLSISRGGSQGRTWRRNISRHKTRAARAFSTGRELRSGAYRRTA
jgi:cell division protein FtsW